MSQPSAPAPEVRLRRPELDELDFGLLNCPQPPCKGRASLQVVKGGYKCHVCSAFYEYLQLDDRPAFADAEESGEPAQARPSQEQRSAASRQAAAHASLSAKIEQLDRGGSRQALAASRLDAAQLQAALVDASTHCTARPALRKDLAELQLRIQSLEAKAWRDYCERRVSAAKHLLERHFGDAGSGRPLGEQLATKALALFSVFVQRRPVRIHNVRCALSAAIVVVSSQLGECRPFSEADVWRRLSVPTGVVATRPMSSARRHCLPELRCDLTQSIRSYRREMGELLPQLTASPQRSVALEQLVRTYVGAISPPLCEAFRARVDAQLQLALDQLFDRSDEHCALLGRCSDATLASAVICSALHSFFVPLHGQLARVSAQWVTRLTQVSRGRIQAVSQVLRRLPLV